MVYTYVFYYYIFSDNEMHEEHTPSFSWHSGISIKKWAWAQISGLSVTIR